MFTTNNILYIYSPYKVGVDLHQDLDNIRSDYGINIKGCVDIVRVKEHARCEVEGNGLKTMTKSLLGKIKKKKQTSFSTDSKKKKRAQLYSFLKRGTMYLCQPLSSLSLSIDKGQR